MLDPQIFPLVKNNVAEFNPLVANGFVKYEVEQAMSYVNKLIQSASKDFPDGLVYLGLSKIDPYKSYEATIKNKTYNLSKSTVFVVKANFEYKGEPLKDYYILLPYLEQGGTMTISGAVFAVTPVLIDKTFNVTSDSIFLYVNRSKLTSRQISHIYLENGRRVSEFTITAILYYGRNSTKVEAARLRPTYKMDILAVHYLLAKYGIREMFRKYAGVEVFFGSSKDINPTAYPPEQFTICQSTQLKPAKLKVPDYFGSDFTIALRNEDMNMVTRCMLAGLFYIIDWYPERIRYDSLEDNKLWYLLLALTIKPEVAQEAATIEKLDDHFRSLETFIDDQVRETLETANLYVNDIFDILADLIKTYPERINIDTSTLASMYDKRLVILRYLMADVRENIFRMGFGLQAMKASNKPVTKVDIENTIKKWLKSSTILKASGAGHDEVNAISNPTDNIVPLMTLPIKLQSSMARKNKKGAAFTFTPALALSASIGEVGNLTSAAKEDFTGRSRLNPHVQIGYDGTILRNPILKELIDKTEAELKHD